MTNGIAILVGAFVSDIFCRSYFKNRRTKNKLVKVRVSSWNNKRNALIEYGATTAFLYGHCLYVYDNYVGDNYLSVEDETTAILYDLSDESYDVKRHMPSKDQLMKVCEKIYTDRRNVWLKYSQQVNVLNVLNKLHDMRLVVV